MRTGKGSLCGLEVKLSGSFHTKIIQNWALVGIRGIIAHRIDSRFRWIGQTRLLSPHGLEVKLGGSFHIKIIQNLWFSEGLWHLHIELSTDFAGYGQARAPMVWW
jgi:hypothetical protein